MLNGHTVTLLSVIFATDVPFACRKRHLCGLYIRLVLWHCLSMRSWVWAPDSEGGRGKITRFVLGGRRGIWPDLPREEHGGLG